jgi:hypothetical protein
MEQFREQRNLKITIVALDTKKSSSNRSIALRAVVVKGLIVAEPFDVVRAAPRHSAALACHRGFLTIRFISPRSSVRFFGNEQRGIGEEKANK